MNVIKTPAILFNRDKEMWFTLCLLVSFNVTRGVKCSSIFQNHTNLMPLSLSFVDALRANENIN